MNKYNEVEYRFELPLCRMYADFCEADAVVGDVLRYMAEHKQDIITIMVLAENISAERKVGVRNGKGMVKSFKLESTCIGRPRAERIVEKLVFAGLVDVSPQLPLKVLTLSLRGKQVVYELALRQEEQKKRQDAERGFTK